MLFLRILLPGHRDTHEITYFFAKSEPGHNRDKPGHRDMIEIIELFIQYLSPDVVKGASPNLWNPVSGRPVISVAAHQQPAFFQDGADGFNI